MSEPSNSSHSKAKSGQKTKAKSKVSAQAGSSKKAPKGPTTGRGGANCPPQLLTSPYYRDFVVAGSQLSALLEVLELSISRWKTALAEYHSNQCLWELNPELMTATNEFHKAECIWRAFRDAYIANAEFPKKGTPSEKLVSDAASGSKETGSASVGITEASSSTSSSMDSTADESQTPGWTMSAQEAADDTRKMFEGLKTNQDFIEDMVNRSTKRARVESKEVVKEESPTVSTDKTGPNG
jgi:hypothetical protein